MVVVFNCSFFVTITGSGAIVEGGAVMVCWTAWGGNDILWIINRVILFVVAHCSSRLTWHRATVVVTNERLQIVLF